MINNSPYRVEVRAPHTDSRRRRPHEITPFTADRSDNGLDYLDNSVNEWLDSHPEVEVTNTSTVGMYDGKIKEPRPDPERSLVLAAVVRCPSVLW